MKRRLSSLATPFYKFTPPVLLVVGLLWLIYDYANVKLRTLYFFIVLAFITAQFFRLKKVHLSQDVLYVSGYLREIAIPLDDIKRVEVSSWFEGLPRMISLDLSNCSAFGRRIVFISRGWGFFTSENADEIRTAIEMRHNKALQLTAR